MKLKTIFISLRPHQWVKNLLIFFPLIPSHQYGNSALLVKDTIAFLSFSLIASATYIINDIIDREDDQKHASKKNRPFASGKLSVHQGILLVCLLTTLSITVGYQVQYLLPLLGVYVAMSLAYSFFIKKTLYWDIILLSLFYCFRVVIGLIITELPISPWILFFIFFFFLSLAFLKRFNEISAITKQAGEVSGRKYSLDDASLIQIQGISTGYLAILTLGLYINSDIALNLYENIEYLWGLIPLAMFWQNRLWYLANKKLVEYDPVTFAVKDRTSYVISIAAFILVFLASK